MRRSFSWVLASLWLGACTTLGGGHPETCHGARRPANPHGSVLAPASPESQPTAMAPATGGCGGPRP